MDFKIPLILVTLAYACVIFMTSDALPIEDVLEREMAEDLGLYKPLPDRRGDRLLASLANSGKSNDYGFGMGFGKRSSPLSSRKGVSAWREAARQRLMELNADN